MMLNMQMHTQEAAKQSVMSVVSRAVAESSTAFKEDAERRLQEKNAEEARKLSELRRKAAADVVDVEKSKLNAVANKGEEDPVNAAVAAEPATRGTKLDVSA